MHVPRHARNSVIHVLVLTLLAIQTPNAVGGNATRAVLNGHRIRVEADLAEGRLRERYLAKTDEDTWAEVATSEGVSGGPICLQGVPSNSGSNSPQEIPAAAMEVSASAREMTEIFSAGPYRIVRKISLDGSGPWLRVTTRLEPSQTGELQSIADRFAFSQRAEWSYSPSVGGFNPDAQYKAPLILVQSNRLAFGIVPDVAALHRDALSLCSHALDLDVTARPLLRVGFMPAQMARHSVYRMDAQRAWKLEKPLENTYFLLVTATAEAGQAYRQCVRFHWERFGRPSQSAAAGQQKGTGPYQDLGLWDQWRQRVWEQESRKAWLQIVLPDGSVGGGVSTSRALGPRSVYLSSWFNSLRTAFGMALYARRTGNDDLLGLASQTVELALKSPGVDGAFKCIAARDKDDKLVWGAGDGSGGSTIQGYLGYDMSWTAYWLLRWREARLPGQERVLPRCQGLARFLIARQQPDGMFATFFDEAGNPLPDKLPYAMAETGPVALFLLKLYEADKNPEYLSAAQKGLAFLDREVIRQRKWYDFETFWSCSPRGIGFDPRTGQWPANNLALGQTVAAFLYAWRVTGDRGCLEKGESLLDYLLLYQQCWTHPLLSGLTGPAMLLGGFTTQNSDAEWSDARQSQIGNILLDYYRATGKVEYLERGVAALRAQFPISPSENWAHGGYGGKAGVSSFHWGSGSGMAGIEIAEEFLRDAIVDVASGAAVGVNGLDVARCEIGDGKIAMEIDSPFQWQREPVLVFRNVGSSGDYALTVNRIVVGTYKAAELESGIAIPLRAVSLTRADDGAAAVGVAAAEVRPEGRDSAALAAAIQRSGAGTTIRLPEGTFELTESVRLKSGVRLIGAGQDKTVFLYSGDEPDPFISLTDCEDVEIAHLTLDGRRRPLGQDGIRAGNCRRLRLHHLTIRDLVKGKSSFVHGIIFSGHNPTMERGVTDCVISDCRIENIGLGAEYGGGIRMAWGSVRNRVERNIIRDTGRGGIFGDHSAELVIRDNQVSGSGGEGLGIEIWGGCPRSLIEDNIVDHWISVDQGNRSAVRRNLVGVEDDSLKGYGIEIIASDLIVTDNLVKRGAAIGLSVSNKPKKNNVFWGYNTIRDCIQWGAQLQGETGGIAHHYLYRCTFDKTIRGDSRARYPGDSGHGFRFNGSSRGLVFEECSFRDNGGYGVQFGGPDVDDMTFLRCVFSDNGQGPVVGLSADKTVEFKDCTVGSDTTSAFPPTRAFSRVPPIADFQAPPVIRAGAAAPFECTSRSGAGEIVERLWDFNHDIAEVGADPQHTFDRPGKYRVTLIVWDAAGRGARAEKVVEVLPAQ